MSDTVRPFHCGTQYLDWESANCCSCSKAAKDGVPWDQWPCDIQRALSTACFGDGTIPLEIADRMGRAEWRYNWPCKEHDPPFANVRADGTVDPSIKPPAKETT